MPLFKFSIVLFLFSLNCLAIDDNECLKSSFEVNVNHKGQPFGLLPVKLSFTKKGCILNISHEKLKFFKNNWEIDVCREPVHIKNGRGAVEVLKRTGNCDGSENSSYCAEQAELFRVMQDDGLIFASGEKENLATDHGKVYCSYLLIKKYLQDSLVFNRGQNYKGVLSSSLGFVEKEVSIEKEAPSAPEAPRPTIVGGDPSTPAPDEDNQASQPVVEDNIDEEKEGTGSF